MPSQTHHELRRRYTADVRQAILDAAEQLLAEEGVDGFSMRRLASRCGCTAPTIYHYFSDKPGLIATVLEARLQKLVQELRALPRSDDPVARVCSLAGDLAVFGVRHPGHYQLLVMDGRDGAPESPSRQELRRIFEDSLEDLVRRGELYQRDLERLRQGVWSLIHGFILLQTTRPDEEWEPDLLDRSLDALIRGSLLASDTADREPSPADVRKRG